jgi:transposase InsO family protein
MQNGYIKCFNRLYKKAMIDAYFLLLDEVRYLTQEWMEEFNQCRLHEA